MPGPDWAYWSLAIALGLTAAAGLYWALIADWRAGRGKPSRRRCQRCWYDMKGVPTTICPECGAAPKDESRLSGIRRRWLAAGVCVAIAVLAAASGLVPKMRRDGVWSPLPTGALLWIESIVGIEYWEGLTEERRYRITAPDISDETVRELVRREPLLLEFRPVWPEYLPVAIHAGMCWLNCTRPNVAETVEVKVEAQGTQQSAARTQAESYSQTWGDGLVIAGRAPKVQVSIARRQLASGAPPARIASLVLPIKFVATVDEIISPVCGAEADAAVAKFLSPRLVIEEHGVRLLMGAGVPSDPGGWRDVAIGFRFEILHEDEVVASSWGWAPYDTTNDCRQGRPLRHAIPLHHAIPIKPSVLSAALPLDPSWKLRIRGDGEIALRDFRAKRYWKGEIEMPLADAIK